MYSINEPLFPFLRQRSWIQEEEGKKACSLRFTESMRLAASIYKGVKYKGEILGRDIGIFFNTVQQPATTGFFRNDRDVYRPRFEFSRRSRVATG